MPHVPTTATKDAWAVASNPPAGLPAPHVVAPPAFPGLALAVPVDVADQIDALTRSALDGASLSGLPTFDGLATEATFGPDVGRLAKAGLSRPLAASLARWGSALYHLGTRLADARTAAQWASGKHQRAIDRRKEVDTANLVFVRKRAGQWGGAGIHQQWRDDITNRPDLAPPGRDADATQARLAAYRLEGRLRHLLVTGGIPCRMAVALAATFDGAGWSETACMLAGEMDRPGTKPVIAGWIASVAHDAVRWAELTWRTTEGPPAMLRLPAG